MKNKKSKNAKCEIDFLRERMVNLLFTLDEQKTKELLEVLKTGLAISEVNKRYSNSKSMMMN